MDMTVLEWKAIRFGRVVGGGAGHEILVGFILGGGGGADGMVEFD